MNLNRIMTVEETKLVELDILSRFDEFCRENSLRYFLAYGTLIGAVRHSGFIPWDDDVDVQMPRADYNKLIELLKGKRLGSLRLIAPDDRDARHTFAKLVDDRTVKLEAGHRYKTDADYRGIDIDIFPIDGQPSDADEYKKWYKKLKRVYRKIWMREIESSGDLKLSLRFAIVLFKLIRVFIPKRERLMKKAQQLHAMYPYEGAEFVGCVESYFNGIGNRCEREAYDECVMLDFEGKSFKAPCGYHSILTGMYGDYMRLPPEEQRVTHHTNNSYWREGNEEV